MKSRTRNAGMLFVVILSALPASHAQALTYKEVVLADGPRYYWNWDDGSFGQTDMISSNLGAGAGGQLYATKSWAVAPTSGISNAGGLSLSNTAAFPGTSYDNWFTYSPGAPMNDGTYTNWAAEFWVNVDSTMADPEVEICSVNDDGVVYFGYNTNTANIIFIGTALQAMSMNTWHHVVLGKNGGVGTCIIDGNVAGKTTGAISAAAVFDATSGGFMRIGSWAGYSALFKGKIDEYAIYNLTGFSQAAYDAKLATIARHYSARIIPRGTIVIIR